MTPDDRETSWEAVWEALPARWQIGPPSQDPHRSSWSVTARGPHPGRGKAPVSVTGTGETEVDALRDLKARLRGVPRPQGSHIDELWRRARLAYVAGAEDETRRITGRPMTADELGRIIDRAP